MSAPSFSNTDIEVVRSWDGIASRWEALARLAAPTPFQTSLWLANWYSAFGQMRGVEPLIVAVRDTTSGRDDLILPLVRRTSFGVRRVEFADLWVSDYNAPIIHPHFDKHAQFESEIWPKILRAIQPADILNFTKMPKRAGKQINPIAGLSVAMSSPYVGNAVAMPATWTAYLEMISKDTRRATKRRWAKFAARPNAGLKRVVDREEAHRVLDALQEQQLSRLRSRNVKHVFDDKTYRDFYRHHVLSGLETGEVALYALYDDAVIVATFLAILKGDHCTLIRSSQRRDDAWKPFGLGKLIMFQSLEHLHSEGCRIFDLSIGSDSYKSDFGVSPIPLAELHLPLSWRALPITARRLSEGALARHPRIMTIARTLSAAVFRDRPA